MSAERKSCILLNGIHPEYFNCEKGVRQGVNLSPQLFSLYLNDLENFLQSKDNNGIEIAIDDDNIELCIKLFAILYVDDGILMSDVEKQFQNLLYYFAEYCKKWHLKINISKN